MSPPKHIIKRTVIEVTARKATNGFNEQIMASNFFKEKIYPLIESILDELASADEITRLDRIELNIGKLVPDRDNSGALHTLEARLREKLHEALKKRAVEQFYLKETGTVKKIPGGERLEELFFYLLKYGTLPWWTGTDEKIKLDELAMRLLNEPSAGFSARLIAALAHEAARVRISHQLPETVFENLLQAATAAEGDHSPARETYHELDAYFRQRAFGRPGLKESLRKYLLAHFRSTFPGRKKFIAGFMEELNDFLFVKELYLGLAEPGSETPFETDLKQALAYANRYYMGRIKRLFSAADQVAYFAADGTNASLEQKRENDPQSPARTVENNEPDIHERTDTTDLLEKLRIGEDGISFPEPDLYEGVEADRNEHFHVSNAGIIILWPYLLPFFTELGLIAEKKFVSREAAQRAAYLLQYLVEGHQERYEEHDMTLNKILCDMDTGEPLTLRFEIAPREAEECKSLLKAVADNWTALRGTSGEGMRDTFFRREGVLERQGNGWNLKIEKVTFDVLVDRLPWSISIVNLPWSDQIIFVNW